MEREKNQREDNLRRREEVYSFELDWEKEKIVAGKFELAISELQKEVMDFISFLRSMIK